MKTAVELAILERSPYPEKAAFVNLEEPNASDVIDRAIEEDRAVVLVAADGSTRTLFSEGRLENDLRAPGKHADAISNPLLEALDKAYGLPGKDRDLREAVRGTLEEALDDPQLSASLLRGLAILSTYGPDRSWRTIIDLAQELGMAPSTTHRYVKTLRAVGLLEQHPSTREYRPTALSGH
ncbi:MAG TPA: helix-turn-helix domain-containing protein [Solirubrobacteraceae bacterium]|jgi:AraC-like DNA-binding protein